MIDGKAPYSVHSFMLPFRWDYLPVGYDIETGKEAFDFEKRTHLKSFLSCLLADNSKWKRRFFKIDGKPDNFNEFHYFHAYTCQTLFDRQQSNEPTETDINEKKVLLYFELPVNSATDTYTIKLQSDKIYELSLTGISLHVYNTGVCILTINVENNNENWEKEDVLNINEFGRRIYPQFLTQENPLDAVKDCFLADKITIHINGAQLELEDNFSDYEKLNEREAHHFDVKNDFIRSWVVRAPSYIRGLFGPKFSFIQADEKPDTIRLNILTDDRMFYQCWYGNNTIANYLKINEANAEYPYLTNDYWHALIFGDTKNSSIANKKMQANLTEKHTYARWAGYGTLYGLTKDSFVCLTNSDGFSSRLRTQMKTIYYQMAVLSLAQRASVLRFSAEVSILSDIAKSDTDDRLIPNIKVLYKNYIEFINKIYYREITPYIQGMEMYRQFQDIMELKENVKDLDEELNELFTYIKLEEDEKLGNESRQQSLEAAIQSKEAHKLSLIASIFLPATFLVSVIALFSGDLRLTGFQNFDMPRFGAVTLILIVVFIAFRYHKPIIKWLNNFFYKDSKPGED